MFQVQQMPHPWLGAVPAGSQSLCIAARGCSAQPSRNLAFLLQQNLEGGMEGFMALPCFSSRLCWTQLVENPCSLCSLTVMRNWSFGLYPHLKYHSPPERKSMKSKMKRRNTLFHFLPECMQDVWRGRSIFCWESNRSNRWNLSLLLGGVTFD